MVNVSVFDHLEPYLGPSGPFWTISDKNICLPKLTKKGLVEVLRSKKFNSLKATIVRWCPKIDNYEVGSFLQSHIYVECHNKKGR